MTTVQDSGGPAHNDLLTLSRLVQDDLPCVAHIHMLAFPRSALTRLGKEAVRRYYEWQLLGPHDSVALGAVVDGELVGFCFGGVFRGALSGFVRKNRLFLAWRILIHPWLVTNPLIRDRLKLGTRVLRWTARGPVPRATSRAASEQHRSFGILAIAVHPASQGLGIGKMLMQEAERIALQRGFTSMHLTVATDNLQAIGFYERQGWRKHTTTGEWTGQMRKTLSL